MIPGLFDLEERYALLEKLGDPLPKLNRAVDWEAFRPLLAQVHDKPRKSKAGRKPYDVVLMFKVLVIQHLYNLSDDQVEYQIRDRHSFCRFLGLKPEGRVPDAKTVWLFRERLKELELVDELFCALMRQIEAAGFVARQGQIVDASMVQAPRQRNSRQENEAIKEGKMPEGWEDKPHQLRQKDRDARWTKKHNKTFYGYKNHISIDCKHKLIRHFEVSDASVHDGQMLDFLLDDTNTSADLWGDAAYRSKDRERLLAAQGYRSHIHTKGQVNRPLNERQKVANRRRSKIRARVEHVFASQAAMGGQLVRTIGLARARVKIVLNNMLYNLKRFAYLQGATA
ncbi:IS5 family transposase [Ectothiorhodospira haloalkaliphila]|uniref:IS5 family transposase n=1 Tax=Ectothiorhodospira haloalkaliphila TaxID=421628 RepID=UPI001EE7AEA7|nr:IS5 family transposase [Ectothiorhodospira haloalkaliphila]MCG5526422.1 IS5 family transposase [Ectothiorhodospira haloalkaliphila]